MAMDIGAVQTVSTSSDGTGWGFNLKDSTGRRWITLTYRTEAEAKVARGNRGRRAEYFIIVTCTWELAQAAAVSVSQP